MSTLLEALLLRVHLQVVDGATAPMSTLPHPAERVRASELPLVRGHCRASGESPADMCEY